MLCFVILVLCMYVFLRIITRIFINYKRSRAVFSHKNSQQPLPNNALDIRVVIEKAPAITAIPLLVLLLVTLPTLLPHHVGCSYYCCYFV